MKIKSPGIQLFNVLVLTVLMFLPSTVLGNEEVAKLPYDKLLQIQDTMMKTLPKDQPFYFHIFSSDPEVTRSDIVLHLVSKNEKIIIPLDKRGFIELPIRRDLVGQEVYIVSNQPKGSMVLRGESRSRVPLKNKAIHYSDLISPVVAANSARKITKNVSEKASERYMESIHLFVDNGAGTSIIVKSDNHILVELFPDKDGIVQIPVEENLLAKNPVVEFPDDNVFFINPWDHRK